MSPALLAALKKYRLGGTRSPSVVKRDFRNQDYLGFLAAFLARHWRRLSMSHGSATPTPLPAMRRKSTGCSFSLGGRALAATLHPNRGPTDGGATGKGEEGQADPPQDRGVFDPTNGSTSQTGGGRRWDGWRVTLHGTGGCVGFLRFE